MLSTGIKGKCSVTVCEENSAQRMGSGTLEVFATPAMIALIEKTAWTSVAAYLEDGQGTVGTRLEISHTAPTPLRLSVTCETELTQIDRRRLVFAAKVYDETGLVGEGTHERFIIDEAGFMEKARGKRDSAAAL